MEELLQFSQANGVCFYAVGECVKVDEIKKNGEVTMMIATVGDKGWGESVFFYPENFKNVPPIGSQVLMFAQAYGKDGQRKPGKWEIRQSNKK